MPAPQTHSSPASDLRITKPIELDAALNHDGLTVGFYGATPTIQAAAIADPAETTAGNNAAIDSILAALRSLGLIAT